MLPDLERLIRLQKLHDLAEEARQRIAAIPFDLDALQTRLADRHAAVSAAQQRLGDDRSERRTIEQDLAVVQSRLTKFRDQLMEVKTNREYQAMQKEIATAEHDVHSFEDRILESLLQADTLAADVAREEDSLRTEQAVVAEEQRSFEEEHVRLEAELTRTAEAREVLIVEVTPTAMALFEHVAKQRRGAALAEARDGLCTYCHVRLRPQIFNEVRRNDSLVQCESCNRILHFNEWPDAESLTQP